MNMLKVWLIKFPENIELKEFYSILNDDEIENAKRFKFNVNRAHSVLSRFYIRKFLSEFLSQPPDEIKISFTPFGKPYLDNGKIQFNISHSGEYILLAISDFAMIGVDIEKINKRISIHEIASRFFTEHEYAMIQRVNKSEQYDVFYQLWTRKESFIKAHGDGLSIPLHDFEVDINVECSCLKKLSLKNEDPEDWMVYSIDAPEGYRAALTLKWRDFVDTDVVNIVLS